MLFVSISSKISQNRLGCRSPQKVPRVQSASRIRCESSSDRFRDVRKITGAFGLISTANLVFRICVT